MYGPVNHTVYLLVRTPLLVSVHCNESLFWFEASDFCYTIDAGPLAGSSWLYSHCCPVSWRFCSFGSTGLAPLHAPAVYRCGRCRDGLSQSFGSEPGWQLGWSAHQISLITTSWVSSPALLQPAGPMQQTARNGARSLALMP